MDQGQSQFLQNPFPGLRPFESSENHLFFGRDGQSNELLRKLRETHFLAVVGTSGSGKSSLVRAGLLPDLYSGMMAGSTTNWRVAIFRPGGNPMDNMARALSQPGVLVQDEISEEDRHTQEQFIGITLGRSALGLVECLRQANLSTDENLLVVVDQFEEIFRFVNKSTLPTAHDQAVAFVKVLLTSIQQQHRPIYVVITMRSDYLGDCSRFRNLPEAINDGQYLIPRMTRNQRREAICGPIAVGGAQIKPQLVQKLLNDVGSNPDQLPIMQHALMRTWDHWKENGAPGIAIDISDYEAIGGIEQALSLHADKAYAEIAEGYSAEEGQRRQKIVEKIFKLLTEKGADNREIRRQALLSDLVTYTGASMEEIISVIEVFRKPEYSFLMPPKRELKDDTVIDISHESLIRQWKTLSVWVDEEAESSKIFLRLAESAQLHLDNKKDNLFGLELDQYLEWRVQFKPDLAWAKRYSTDCDKCLRYLEESQQQREDLLQEKKSLALKEEIRRKKELKRTRVFAMVLAFATLVSIGFLIYAQQQKELALTQRDIARANYQISKAQSQVEKDPTVALRLAELAAKISSSPLVLNAAHKIYRENVFYKTLFHKDEVHSVAFSQDNNHMLTGSKDGVARIWKIDGEIQLEIPAHEGGVNAVAFGPNGNYILTGGADGFVKLWNLDGSLQYNFKHTQPISAVAFSPNGRQILTGSETARLWDLKGHLQQVIGQAQISSMAFSPDGNTILTASYDRSARIWDLKGNMLKEFGGDSDYIFSVAFAPDSRKVLTGSVDGVAKLWDIRGDLIDELNGHSNRISSVAFSPDGTRMLTGSFDNYIRLWDLDGNQIYELKGHVNRISSVAFSADGTKVLSGSYDRTARLWELKGKLVREFDAHNDYIFSVAYSPDGTKLLTGSYDQTARLWGLNGNLLSEMKGHNDRINSIAFSPDGTKILTGSEDSKAFLWELNGVKLQEFAGHKGGVSTVAFSPDGTKVISGSADHSIRLWDLNGKFIKEIGKHDDRVSTVAFSPDGTKILTTSWDKVARIWSLDGDILVQFEGHADQIYSGVFSPDGSKVLTGSGDGSVQLWNIEGKALLELSNHPGIVSAVAFSPDGSSLLTATLGNSARLWDLNGNMLKEYPGQIIAVAFSPDGGQILTGSTESVQLWDGVINLDEFLQSGRIDELKTDPEND